MKRSSRSWRGRGAAWLLGSLGGALVDQAVADRLGGGEGAVLPGVFADVFGVTAAGFRDPVEERVDHAPDLLFPCGHRRHRAAELQLRLRQREGRVRVRGTVRARGEHAERGTGYLP